ncbi:MAG: glycosyltransferase family 2 protein [Bacteroidales bacterium]|nr:glycosyltransferase family 2 protein [Bacteroidales bacterium]
MERVQNSPKVSVIIPVYNVENLLPRCLDSLIAQTLTNIEILCVDDGSKDNSLAVLRRYEERDSRIKVVTQQNKRQGGARNTGMDMACGEYIGFVDSDDYVDKDYFQKLYEAAVRESAHIACCGIIKHKPHMTKYVAKYEGSHLFTEKNAKFKICNCPPDFHPVNKLYSRQMLLENHIRYQEHVYYEDVAFVSKAILCANAVVTVPETLYHYMYNGESTVKSRQTLQKQQDMYSARKGFVEMAAEMGIEIPCSYKSITYRVYEFCGINLLKVKERNGVRVWRLFDLIPIFKKKG